MASTRFLMILTVVPVFFGGYEGVTRGNNGSAAAFQSVEGRAPTAKPPSAACPVSKAVKEEPLKDPNADPVGFGDWFVNADRTIWVRKDSWQAGSDGNKVYWVRPAGTKLGITGRRIDAPAPPPRATADSGYPTGFTVTGLYFESPGCWELAQRPEARSCISLLKL